ncbi:type II secretion system protein N [Porticoccus sp. W117]|uniref:type II secretion system protein N n=1 Tax=Porticoccus sp. W117 TaxID=3054777 RepID=UPI0025931B97|nr:type II secretion system protein N [Porticoccus sp. W117]MDM3869765.1 type II secretion system protein N [Porticoccus sp. W117]
MAESELLTGIDPNSTVMRAVSNVVAAVKRVPMLWWQGVVVVLLLLVLASSAAKLFWALWPEQKQEQVVKATLSLPQSDGNSGAAGVDVGKLLQLNVYGVAGELAAEQPVDFVLPDENIEAEDTKLALKLTGVLNSSDPKLASAMIAHNNKHKSYKVGDKLPAGRNVTLDRVLDRRVILNNAGRYESLWLFEGMNGEGLLVETPQQQNTVVNNSSTAQPQTQARTQTVSQPTAERSVVVELPTPETLAQVVRVTPHKKGFEVKPLKNLAQFEQLGFKSGDVVTEVNGTPVSLNPEQMRQLYLEVLQSPTAQMQVLRGNRQVNLNIDLANLAKAINE